MDPTANLKEQRQIIKQINACNDGPEESRNCTCDEHAARLAELAEALDQWISKGGALPAQWQVAQRHKAIR